MFEFSTLFHQLTPKVTSNCLRDMDYGSFCVCSRLSELTQLCVAIGMIQGAGSCRVQTGRVCSDYFAGDP